MKNKNMRKVFSILLISFISLNLFSDNIKTSFACFDGVGTICLVNNHGGENVGNPRGDEPLPPDDGDRTPPATPTEPPTVPVPPPLDEEPTAPDNEMKVTIRVKYVEGNGDINDNTIVRDNISPEYTEELNQNEEYDVINKRKDQIDGLVFYKTVGEENGNTGEGKNEIVIIHYFNRNDETINPDEGNLTPPRVDNKVEEKVNITIRYVEGDGNVDSDVIINDNLSPSYNEEIKKGEGYNLRNKRKEIDGYRLYRTEGIEVDNYAVDNMTVTHYYVKKEGNVIIRYLDKETRQSIDNDFTLTDKVNKDYNVVNKKKDVIGDYIYESTEGDEEGRIVEGNIEIIHYYTKKEGNVVVKYLDKDTRGSIDNDYTLRDKINKDYDVTDKKKDLIGDYVYESTTGNERGTIANGNTEIIHYYKKKEGNIIVKYIDKATNKSIDNDYTLTDKVNKEYNVTDKKKNKIGEYTYDSTKGNEQGRIVEGDTVIIYYYTKESVPPVIDTPRGPGGYAPTSFRKIPDDNRVSIGILNTKKEEVIIKVKYVTEKNGELIEIKKEYSTKINQGDNYDVTSEKDKKIDNTIGSYQYIKTEGIEKGITKEGDKEIVITHFYSQNVEPSNNFIFDPVPPIQPNEPEVEVIEEEIEEKLKSHKLKLPTTGVEIKSNENSDYNQLFLILISIFGVLSLSILFFRKR